MPLKVNKAFDSHLVLLVLLFDMQKPTTVIVAWMICLLTWTDGLKRLRWHYILTKTARNMLLATKYMWIEIYGVKIY